MKAFDNSLEPTTPGFIILCSLGLVLVLSLFYLWDLGSVISIWLDLSTYKMPRAQRLVLNALIVTALYYS